MKISLSIGSVFLVVTVAALAGMVLGGAFGYVAGIVAPDLFRYLLPWKDFEPIGVATVIGAFGGVVCGGALGAFAVVVQLASELLRKDRTRPELG